MHIGYKLIQKCTQTIATTLVGETKTIYNTNKILIYNKTTNKILV